MKIERALVTGGAGFIGSNLAKSLTNRGTHVTIVDDMSNGHAEFVPDNCELVVADFASGTDRKSVV